MLECCYDKVLTISVIEQCVGTSSEENVKTGNDSFVKETQESELEISNLHSAVPKRRQSSRGDLSEEGSHHHTEVLEEEYTTNLDEHM